MIVAAGGAHASAKAATATIPIVFTTPGEPVKEGLVTSFNKPGGNATGISVFSTTLEAKRLELLHEVAPTALRVGVLIDPNFWTANLTIPELKGAAEKLGKNVTILNVSNEAELEATFASINRSNIDAITVTAGPLTYSLRRKIVELLARSAIPAVTEHREFVEAGALMAYGPSILDVYRWVGIYSGRILKGEKPADLPVLAAIQVLTRDQSQDRQGTRPHRAKHAAGDRGRGDRISTRSAAVHSLLAPPRLVAAQCHFGRKRSIADIENG